VENLGQKARKDPEKVPQTGFNQINCGNPHHPAGLRPAFLWKNAVKRLTAQAAGENSLLNP
jgi:hypothetical protein